MRHGKIFDYSNGQKSIREYYLGKRYGKCSGFLKDVGSFNSYADREGIKKMRSITNNDEKLYYLKDGTIKRACEEDWEKYYR